MVAMRARGEPQAASPGPLQALHGSEERNPRAKLLGLLAKAADPLKATVLLAGDLAKDPERGKGRLTVAAFHGPLPLIDHGPGMAAIWRPALLKPPRLQADNRV